MLHLHINDQNTHQRKGRLEIMIQGPLHVVFLTMFFIKRTSHTRFYSYMELLQSSTSFKQKK